ncbi:hypothetical protein PPL_00473 [Heterostelium album PN500]|uniref:Uncharacterized protein n=1 Tax=Heterostelium pallidum (strain ATCC 26659 / Pp 5 / PN500) TaxID=670386 RepID=D3AWJ8_HETP5|nr:hypothetical protein PPL_00473 [Heterostelium album PN500]EFA86671.1 hypothetical protein PPL_00473 [Heterostelium album PN500]|eukprot:XP_020438775.1 hypothetical protein PPL_00473 [Heterostelium album PN500]
MKNNYSSSKNNEEKYSNNNNNSGNNNNNNNNENSNRKVIFYQKSPRSSENTTPYSTSPPTSPLTTTTTTTTTNLKNNNTDLNSIQNNNQLTKDPCTLSGRCLVCTRGPPKLIQHNTWSNIMRVVIFCLKHAYPDLEFFSLKNHIYDFMSSHWSILCYNKEYEQNWHKQIQDILSHSKKIFESGQNHLNASGHWRLIENIDPWSMPNPKEVNKKKGNKNKKKKNPDQSNERNASREQPSQVKYPIQNRISPVVFGVPLSSSPPSLSIPSPPQPPPTRVEIPITPPHPIRVDIPISTTPTRVDKTKTPPPLPILPILQVQLENARQSNLNSRESAPVLPPISIPLTLLPTNDNTTTPTTTTTIANTNLTSPSTDRDYNRLIENFNNFHSMSPRESPRSQRKRSADHFNSVELENEQTTITGITPREIKKSPRQ